MNLYYMVNDNGTIGIVESDMKTKRPGYYYSLRIARYNMKKSGITLKKLPSEKLAFVEWVK